MIKLLIINVKLLIISVCTISKIFEEPRANDRNSFARNCNDDFTQDLPIFTNVPSKIVTTTVMTFDIENFTEEKAFRAKPVLIKMFDIRVRVPRMRDIGARREMFRHANV